VWALVLLALLAAIALLLIRFKRLGWRGLKIRTRPVDSARSAIEFYERLTRLLIRKGFKRAPDQTPLEFATSAGLNEAVIITGAYNRVRFGAEQLSAAELSQIEALLSKAEREEK
jgi:hypothetical protein